MQNTMDFSPLILSSLEEKLDVGEAFPIVHTMTPQTIELFMESMFIRLHKKILTVVKDGGEECINKRDVLGLALLVFREGVNLPSHMLFDICKDIVQKSQRVAKWICPTGNDMPGERGGVYYCRMLIDLSQDEDEE